jgi:hypothetical protein
MLLDAPYLYLTSNIYSSIVKNISGKSLTNRYYSGALVYIALAIGVITLVIPNVRTNSLMNIVKDSLITKRGRQLICNVIGDLAIEQIITISEYSELTNYITEYLKNNEHVVILLNNNSIVKLLFNINDLESRLNWINEQIQLLK